MDLDSIKEDVYVRLDEEEANPAFYAEADVKDAINDGYDEFTEISEWREASVTLSLYSGKTYYDMRTVVSNPELFMRVKAVYNATTKRWMDPQHHRFLDTLTHRRWETISVTEPEIWFMRGHHWMGVFPRKSSDAGTLTVLHALMPTHLSADADTPGFWEDLHMALVEYAVYELLCQDKEFEKADKYLGYFLEKALDAKKRMDSRSYADRLGNIGGITT